MKVDGVVDECGHHEYMRFVYVCMLVVYVIVTHALSCIRSLHVV